MTVKKKGTPKDNPYSISKSPASISAGKYKPTVAKSTAAAKGVKSNIGKLHPVTGKPMSKAEADAMARQLEKKKRS